ncbi:zinc-binding alcohol dehydrogenase family protein [Aspergillus stella-maris]|uniref:zinc-binding alcohol dehydrogenase family protein n=1 Tax=Aspergillus stella-maris TaxID=1810926 RepID=UPI003CCD6036
MATHPAITATGIKQPLTITNVATRAPQGREVQVRVEWVASAPLDVYQVDAGLMAQFPQCLGDSAAGTVVAIGPEVQRLKVSDQIFGFFFHNAHEKGQQVYITAPEHLFGKVPDTIPLHEAATIPTNFCTAFYTLSDKLNLDLPWPRPAPFIPKDAEIPILIWGAGTSVGHYAIQILKHWGYTNIIITASPKHHHRLRQYGAKHAFDYRDPGVTETVRECINVRGSSSVCVFDTISSRDSSLLPISRIVTKPGSIVAAVLPVVINPPSHPEGIKLSPDVVAEAEWAVGVEVHPVVSYAYEENTFLRDHLQPDIMVSLLSDGVIEPNRARIVEGGFLLARVMKAMDIMRSGTVSGERLVWRVWTPEEFPEFA